jgi:hypothetical protein
MTESRSGREVIPAGEQPWFSFQHLVPIAKFLIQERGHGTLPKEESVVSFEWGFVRMNGLRCQLTHRITDEDWAAINERYVMPDNIGYRDGLIRDNVNSIDIEGIEAMVCEDGVVPIEEWEERQRAAGRMP